MSEATNKKYRATFILDTRTYQDPVETLTDKIKATLESLGFSVIGVKNVGSKDFVRVTDRHFPSGIYVQYDMEGPAKASTLVQEKFRLDKTVDRILLQAV